MASTVDKYTRVTLTELSGYVRRAVRTAQPVMIWGGPGIGKSTIIHDIAKSYNGAVVELRLGQVGPQDIIGVPYFNRDNQTMKWAPPEALPSAEFAAQYDKVFLFLDEITSGAPAVQAAAYQLILDRKVGQYVLPDNVVVIAAGNEATDRGLTYTMLKPLQNRFKHYHVKVDYDSWLDWAASAKIHQDIIAYISWSKEKLYQFNANDHQESFPTPRSWSRVSSDLADFEKYGGSEKELLDEIASSIGYGYTTEFLAWRKIGSNLPKPEDVVSGKVTTLEIADISAHYQLAMSVTIHLRSEWEEHSTLTGETKTIGKNFDRPVHLRKWNSAKEQAIWEKKLNTWLRFVMDNFSKELAIATFRIGTANYHLLHATSLENIPVWSEVAKKFNKYLTFNTED